MAPHNKKNSHQNQHLSQTKNNKVTAPRPLVISSTNKHVLGGYFSLGLNNFHKTVLHIFKTVGIKITGKDDNILYSEEKIGVVLRALYKKISNNNLTEEETSYANHFRLNSNQQVNLRKLIFHHFPLLGPIMADEAAYKVSTTRKSHVTDAYTMTYGVSLSECLDVFSTIAQGLVDCRNTSVHYKPFNTPDAINEQYDLQSKIVRYLDKTFVASRRLDKDRNNIDTAKMEFLTGYAREGNLQDYINRNGFFPKYDVLYVNGQKTQKERDDFFYKIGKNTRTDGNTRTILSGFGLCYFCALFLSKSQTKQMLSDIRLFAQSPYPDDCNDIIREIMSIYRIRMFRGKKKLEGSDSKITLALDILNELRKCPRELFDVLTPAGQKYFEDKVTASPNDRTPDVVKRFRSTDRFPYLIMKYIDETELFNNIRFHVRLGKYRFKFYDKTCINGETVVRSLQKEINGFGRLQEIETKRKEKYKDILQPTELRSVKLEDDDLELDLTQFVEDTKDSAPYITDSRAFYNIYNNRIGLYWNELFANGRYNPKPGDYIPDLVVNEENGKAEINMPSPKAMLSVYELPAMIFYQYLLSQNGAVSRNNSAEDIIIAKYNKLRQFFTDVSNGTLKPVTTEDVLADLLRNNYNLKLSEIPDKLVEYLSGKESDNQERKLSSAKEHLILRLQRAIQRKTRYETDRKKIGNRDNKYAKNGYADVRHGTLARYLSESFIEWQPTNDNGRDKLTGLNFSKLQAELAMFDNPEKFSIIKTMLSSARMLDGPIAHPFLRKAVNRRVRNIEELYLFYLSEEIWHLKTFFDIKYKNNIQRDDNIDFAKTQLRRNIDISKIPFIHGKARWEKRNNDYYKNLASRYLEVEGRKTAIWLPDGIFTNRIIALLKNTPYTDNTALQTGMQDDALNNNVAYLINKYFETVLNDNSQPFYCSYNVGANGNVSPNRFARVYDLFNILNNVKKGNALVAVPMTSDQIKERFTNKVATHDSNGNVVYTKQINQEINDYVGRMSYRDKGNHRTLEEAKETMKQRLTRYINNIKDNERTIRRYKTQDMILFLIAKQLMGEHIQNADDEFRLSKVCTNRFLNQTVNFEFSMEIDGKTIYINQDNMSLKNYGEFYQLLSDDRLPSLLKKLAAAYDQESRTVVNYNKLMGELTSYDLHRSSIFNAVHKLEEKVVDDNQFNYLNDPNDEKFYINNDRSEMAKRNNFRSLLQLLEDGNLKVLTEDERELIISIRNAFSHNHYNIDFDKIATAHKLANTTLVHKEGENDKNEQLTTIAKLIADKLRYLQEQIIGAKTN